jgi:hypothetical protein
LAACGDDEDKGDVDGSADGDDGSDGDGEPGDGEPGDGEPGDGGPGDGEPGDGEPGADCDVSTDNGKAYETIPNPTGTITLTNDKNWTLSGITYVEDGDTLTIEPCTRIEGAPISGGNPSVLVVQRGAKIEAVGTADEPILFTGEALSAAEDSDAPGQWGGIILLGRASNNSGANVLIEGLADDPKNQHGGNADEDDSGTMKYVRIEEGGYQLAQDVEVNGLTLGSVGSGTVIDHIMVKNTLDDCFEWFGGTVDATHLIAEGCGDDMFDMDLGYRGSVSKLLGRQKAAAISSSDPNGFETDNNPSGTGPTPATNYTASEVTLCATGAAVSATNYGAVLRRGVTGSLSKVAVTGFSAGFSLRDAFGTAADPAVTIADSLVFGNFVSNLGEPHSSTPDLQPSDWFEMGNNNEVPDPAPYTAAQCQGEDGPTAEVTGSSIGAFASEDDWTQGLWVEWSTL